SSRAASRAALAKNLPVKREIAIEKFFMPIIEKERERINYFWEYEKQEKKRFAKYGIRYEFQFIKTESDYTPKSQIACREAREKVYEEGRKHDFSHPVWRRRHDQAMG